MRVLYPGRIGIWSVGFCGGRKTGEPRKKPLEQGENQQQTQPTYGTGPKSNPGHIDGRRVPIPASKHSLLNYFYLSYTIFVFSFLHQLSHIVKSRQGFTHAVCVITEELYVCDCKEGYRNTTTITTANPKCEDINECKSGTHNCDQSSSECKNNNGSYSCSCRQGFRKSEKSNDRCVG